MGITYFEDFTKENLVQLVNVRVCFLRNCNFWHSFRFWTQAIGWWHEAEITNLLDPLKTLCLHGFQKVNDLWDVAVISLACELKDLIDVFCILTESARILVLTFHVDLHFKGLTVCFGALTFCVVDQSLVYKSFKNRFGDVIIRHWVSCHLHLVEIFILSDDVSHHTLVVHQVNFESVTQIDICMLLPDDLKACRRLGDWAWDHLLNVELIGITHWVPIILNHGRDLSLE